MKVIASAKQVRTSPRKVRLIADSIRRLSISEAQDALSVIDKKGAESIKKVLNSAIANAVNNSKLDKGNLVIESIDVSEGPVLKRFRPSTRGRIHRYQKRSTNLRIVLEEKVATMSVSPKPVEVVESPKVEEVKKEEVK
jgi:large subunit ribosomal protein L22